MTLEERRARILEIVDEIVTKKALLKELVGTLYSKIVEGEIDKLYEEWDELDEPFIQAERVAARMLA